MNRKFGTKKSGGAFSESVKDLVWEQARIVPGYDPKIIRKDVCSAWIEYSKYGDTTTKGKGWEIDHILPVSKGGGDEIDNLQPLQWQNNRSKGEDLFAGNFCVVNSD